MENKISFAKKSDTLELKKLWKTIFEDDDFFIDLYFSEKFQPENALIFKENDEILAALYMDCYEFRFWGEPLPCYYLSGLATLPKARRRGIMSTLIVRSYEVMVARNIPLAILIPASEKMYDFYGKFGYEQVFGANESPMALEKIVDENDELHKSYAVFDKIYRQKDFCIQKTFADFRTIIADWEHNHRPAKTNVAAMARLINPEFLFDIYKQKTGNRLSLDLSHSPTTAVSIKSDVLNVNHRQLCRLLFGYKTQEFPQEIANFFPEHQPALNLMLE